MQIKAIYRKGDHDKVRVEMHAPRDVCVGLHEKISIHLADEGYKEE